MTPWRNWLNDEGPSAAWAPKLWGDGTRVTAQSSTKHSSDEVNSPVRRLTL